MNHNTKGKYDRHSKVGYLYLRHTCSFVFGKFPISFKLYEIDCFDGSCCLNTKNKQYKMLQYTLHYREANCALHPKDLLGTWHAWDTRQRMIG